MRPFDYSKPTDWREAVQDASVAADAHVRAPVQYLGGGTTLLDLMKLDVMRPTALVDIRGLNGKDWDRITVRDDQLWVGSLVSMADAAEHERVVRDYPVVAQSLALAASSQLRNMARLGGNVLQRTRCSYFRDTTYTQCNKRTPGSGCAAKNGYNRLHAVLGTSEACIASYPGDFAQALIALDARVTTTGPFNGKPLAQLHRLPAGTPHIETALAPGELITGFLLPRERWFRRSAYVKVRDRESYAFANASAAVALDLDGETVRQARIALGGVAAAPWRAREAEAALAGQTLTEAAAARAAAAALAGARPYEHNRYKVSLAQATLVRALMETKALTI